MVIAATLSSLLHSACIQASNGDHAEPTSAIFAQDAPYELHAPQDFRHLVWMVHEDLLDREDTPFARIAARYLYLSTNQDALSLIGGGELYHGTPNVPPILNDHELDAFLHSLGILTSVQFTTASEGASVFYQALSSDSSICAPELTNTGLTTIPIGLYKVWTEREGKVSSRKDIVFRLVAEQPPPVELVELATPRDSDTQ